MKFTHFALFAIFFFSLYNTEAKPIYENDELMIRTISLNAANKLCDYFEYNKIDSIPYVINVLNRTIPENEWITRVNILYSILTNSKTDSLILHYFQNEYFVFYYKRLEFEKNIKFGYIYNEYKNYYSYLPLRHKLDSICKLTAENLLANKNLTQDEIVACNLFAGNMEEYTNLVNDVHNIESKVAMLFNEKFFDYHRMIRLDFHAGYIVTLGSSKVFSNSFALGGSFGVNVNKDLLIYVKALFNLKENFKPLYYIDDNIIKNTNSANQILADIMLGYKVVYNKHYSFIPTFGFGMSFISFIEKYAPSENKSSEYTGINTLNLALGFSTSITVSKGKYIGIEMFYQHSFYEYSKILKSKLNNNSITLDIFTNIF